MNYASTMGPTNRTELNELKNLGYRFNDPSDVIDIFEERIAKFAGANYAVATDSNTHALELCLRLLLEKQKLNEPILVPKNTYLSVPMTLMKLNLQFEFTAAKWEEFYTLRPLPIIDAALTFKPNMHIQDSLFCLSFQFKKRLPIGRGGMILLNNKSDHEKLKRMVHDGRTPGSLWKTDKIFEVGYHYQMIPEDAARGLLLFEELKSFESLGGWQNYPDISLNPVFAKYIKSEVRENIL